MLTLRAATKKGGHSSRHCCTAWAASQRSAVDVRGCMRQACGESLQLDRQVPHQRGVSSCERVFGPCGRSTAGERLPKQRPRLDCCVPVATPSHIAKTHTPQKFIHTHKSTHTTFGLRNCGETKCSRVKLSKCRCSHRFCPILRSDTEHESAGENKHEHSCVRVLTFLCIFLDFDALGTQGGHQECVVEERKIRSLTATGSTRCTGGIGHWSPLPTGHWARDTRRAPRTQGGHRAPGVGHGRVNLRETSQWQKLSGSCTCRFALVRLGTNFAPQNFFINDAWTSHNGPLQEHRPLGLRETHQHCFKTQSWTQHALVTTLKPLYHPLIALLHACHCHAVSHACRGTQRLPMLLIYNRARCTAELVAEQHITDTLRDRKGRYTELRAPNHEVNLSNQTTQSARVGCPCVH